MQEKARQQVRKLCLSGKSLPPREEHRRHPFSSICMFGCKFDGLKNIISIVFLKKSAAVRCVDDYSSISSVVGATIQHRKHFKTKTRGEDLRVSKYRARDMIPYVHS